MHIKSVHVTPPFIPTKEDAGEVLALLDEDEFELRPAALGLAAGAAVL